MQVSLGINAEKLREELPTQQFSMWIRPLEADFDGKNLVLYAPNRFVLNWVRDKYYDLIYRFFHDKSNESFSLRFDIGQSKSNVKQRYE